MLPDLEVEESKPHRATAKHRPSETTTTTIDDSSSDAGVTMGYQPKPCWRSPKERSHAADDDDTASERIEIVESREGESASVGH